MAMRS